MKRILTLYFILTIAIVNGQEKSQVFSVKSARDIYLGGVLESNRFNDPDHKVLDIIDDSLRMGFVGLRITSSRINADKSSMDKLLEQELSNLGSEVFSNVPSFSYNLKAIPSYDKIQISFGQNIDVSKWFGIGKLENARTKLVLDITRTSFSTSIDLPNDGVYKVKGSELPKYDLNDLIYVKSISYGRRVMVIIESNCNQQILMAVVKKMVEQSELSKEDRIVIAQTNFTITNFADELIDFNVDAPLENIIKYLGREFHGKDYGTPIKFSASYLINNRAFENLF